MYCPQMYSGSFFYELYQTGMYWRFLRFCQLITALLLFSQRCTAFSTLLFFSISINIFVFVASAGLTDKILIMIPVLFMAVALIAWDWHRIIILFIADKYLSPVSFRRCSSNKMQFFGTVLYIITLILFVMADTHF